MAHTQKHQENTRHRQEGDTDSSSGEPTVLPGDLGLITVFSGLQYPHLKEMRGFGYLENLFQMKMH